MPGGLSKLRIHIHDSHGHAFPIQLSRELSARGHDVLHSHLAAFQSPKGRLNKKESDSASLRIEALDLGVPFAKYSYLQRYLQERRYGALLVGAIQRFCPDVVMVIASPDTLVVAQHYCRDAGIPFVFWLQDMYGVGIRRLLRKKLWGLGALVGWHYQNLDARLLGRSDHIIAITEDFLPHLPFACGDSSRISVIHNWAPLSEFPVHAQSNEWSRRNGLAGQFVFLYSGTLGLKHNPAFLYELARRYHDNAQVRVVVISEGIGAEWLQKQLAGTPLPNLVILPFQSVELLPQVFASANVLVSVLEADAGVFSVPSKVLSYFCAARPVLLSAPPENLAARLVEKNQAGLVAASGDKTAFMAQADRLYQDGRLREDLGVNGRRYAEENFDIDLIAARFEGIFHNLRKATAQAKW